MRVLRIHNRYQTPGGEDVSYEAESALLERMGHEVFRLEFSNDDISDRLSIVDSVKIATNTVWSTTARKRIASQFQRFQPEVVHFDNTFPLVSPAAYGVVKRRGIPVVQSLRNYRLLCPSATLFHNGAMYEENLGRLFPWRAVRDKVYHDSFGQTGVLAAMLVAHRLLGTWQRNVDRYVALTDSVKRLHVIGGLPEDRISVKPNFVDGYSADEGLERSGFLYVGRISPEKGVNTLLNSMKSRPADLTIIGVGDDNIEHWASSLGYSLLGSLPEQQAYQQMASSQAVVCPSEWYEPFGRVVVEAFSQATPVIASRIGGLAEIVEDGVTGLHFEPGNAEDLAAKITWASNHPEEMRRMGENARREYGMKYTPERNYEMLMDIYHQAIEHNASRQK